MKLDLTVAQVQIPNGYFPGTVICLGKEDVGKAMSAGPTLVKTKTPKYRRTLAFNLAHVGESSAPVDQALNQGLKGVVDRARGKLAKVTDLDLDGAPAKTAEIRHKFEDHQVMTFALLAFENGMVRSVMLTVLNDPKVLKEARAEFDNVVKTFRTKG